MVSKMLSNGAKTRPIWFYGVDTQKASLVRILMKVTKQFCQFPFSVFFGGKLLLPLNVVDFVFTFDEVDSQSLSHYLHLPPLTIGHTTSWLSGMQ